MSELNLILLGPPGAGKGTQAERLVEDFDLPYYATGDILRGAVKEGTELGRKAKEYMDRGDLVPDEVISGVIGERIASAEALDGFLLDGFPRTIAQAEALERALEPLGRRPTAVLSIEVPDEEVVRRLSGRRVCERNGHPYHVDFDPPKNDGFCDQDGSPLVQRDDDREDTVKHRLEVFHEQTAPLVGYYEGQGLLRRFDGSRSPDEVHAHIRATLATLKLEEQL
ncbi:MAG TPA: adenylate kinase [Thermoleophilaceae bacterium]|nr:adenylate kinase [Thermoleophilaceae bacterium]